MERHFERSLEDLVNAARNMGADVLRSLDTAILALMERDPSHGNLVFDKSARNFSPLAAMAGQICIAEVEELVEPGDIDPDSVHLPGIYVHGVLLVGTEIEKRIERRTVREGN